MTDREIELRQRSAEKAPVGTWSSAYLITDYFMIENRLRAPIKWRIRTPYAVQRRLRRRIADLDRKLDRQRIANSIEPRPAAGQPPIGPLPLPRCTARQALTPQRPGPIEPLDVPTDALTRPGMTWYFRSGLAAREADRTPLFTCVGLEA